MKNSGILLILASLVIGSCRLGPTYDREENIEEYDTFHYTTDQTTNIADIYWWELFQDSVLVSLIDTAICNNLDLAAAAARIKQAESQLGIVRANLFPRVNYGADAYYDFNSLGNQGNVSGFIPISYQVDLWGRFRNLRDASFYSYLATEEAYRNVTITLISSIANAYFLLRDLDNRIIISTNTAESWQNNLEITVARNDAGMVSEVDVNQAIIQVEEAKAQIQIFRRLRNQTENSIGVLLGKPPLAIDRGLAITEQVLPPSPPAGLPSNLLNRRPDVLLAERSLQAQYFNLGATEALQYPSLTLTADLGAVFLDPSAGFANLGAQLFGPLFNSQENKKRYEVEMARTEELIANYQNTFIVAIKEVEDALIAVETYEKEFESRQKQVESANTALELAWVRYQNGVTSYLEILDLQRSSFNSMLKASEVMQLKLTSTVNLYQALGGGWTYGMDTIIVD